MQDRSDVANDSEETWKGMGVWQAFLRLAQHAAHDPRLPLIEIERAFARAELAGEISEFYSLGVEAILAMARESEDALEYLEMAALVAATDAEQAVVLEWRTLYRQWTGDERGQQAARAAAFRGTALPGSVDGLDDKAFGGWFRKILAQVSSAREPTPGLMWAT